jgi:tousled-like kinase
LEEFRWVAAKVHQVNPNWPAASKDSYLRHAEREMETHSTLKHPNIIQLYETVHIDQDSFCTILEFCDGPDLSAYIKQKTRVSEPEAKLIIKQVIDGVLYLGSSNPFFQIIHYDLKPQNILWQKGVIKIGDFGLCKVLEREQGMMELTSQGLGTYWYLPPECFMSGERPPNISTKLDVWSIGVIFFEMLFGQRPFGHNMSQDMIMKENIMLKATSVPFPPEPPVSFEAKEFIRSCLKYNQEERFSIEECFNCGYFN